MDRRDTPLPPLHWALRRSTALVYRMTLILNA